MKEWNSQFGRSGNGGFTLMELLTVVSIITILLALLLPAIKGARGQGRGVGCLNNQRQIAIAWSLYSGDNGDVLTINPDSVSGTATAVGWVVGNLREATVAHNQELLSDARVSLLASYITEPAVYKCPSDESEFVRSVAMNCRMNPHRFDGKPAWVGGIGEKYKTFRKSQDIGSPSTMFVVMDERDDSINDSYFAIDNSNTGNSEGIGTPRPYRIVDIPANWHRGGAGASFADGHAELHTWRDFLLDFPTEGIHDASAKFSAPDDEDVRWLHEHTTYLR